MRENVTCNKNKKKVVLHHSPKPISDKLRAGYQTYHGDEYFCILDPADEAPVAYVVFPELAQFATLQCLADASRVVQGGKTFAQKAAQSLGDRSIQFGELFFGSLGNLNLPGQGVPPLPLAGGSAPRRCRGDARPVRRGRDPPCLLNIPEWQHGHKKSYCVPYALLDSPAWFRCLPANGINGVSSD